MFKLKPNKIFLKKSKNTAIILLVLGLSLSCNNNNLQQNSNVLNTSIYTSDFEQNDCKSELNKFKLKQETEFKKDYPREELLRTAERVDLTKFTPQDVHGYHPDKILPWVYNDNRNIPNEITEGSINLIFRDEYKIRFDKEKKEFYSLNDYNTSNINNILSNYQLTDIYPSGQDLTEEEAEIKENQFQKLGDYDRPNEKSTYTLFLKNNLKEIVERFREDKNVRQCNFNGYPYADYTPTENDPIFTNVNTLFTGNSLPSAETNQSIRNYYSRIKAYEAWDLIQNISQKPAKIAVIDFGFSTNNSYEDQPYYDTDNKMSCYNEICTIGSSANVEGSNSSEFHGHQVASVIGAPENGKGTVGIISTKLAKSTINPPSSDKLIVPIKVYSNDTNFFKTVKKAIDTIVQNKNTNGIKIINISISSGTPPNTQPIEIDNDVKIAIDNAWSYGILTVITAGNQGQQISISNRSKALVIGGISKFKDDRASSSHYGDRVDIAAPYDDIILPDYGVYNKYNKFSGTSYGAPMVAGLASLIMSTRPEYRDGTSTSIERVKNLIVYSGDLIKADQKLGRPVYNFSNISIPNARMLNMYKALNLAINMNPYNNYARIDNVDFNSMATEYNYAGNTSYDHVDKYYKEEGFIDVSGSNKAVLFNSHNLDCYYSWGYQVWLNGVMYYENAQGVAGKYNPQNGLVVKDQWLDGTNTGVSPSPNIFIQIVP